MAGTGRAPRVRGTTTQRGYGANHRKLRKVLLPSAYGSPCPRCHRLMLPGQKLDLGHTEDRAGWTGMEHASCNRAAGNRSFRRKRRRQRPQSQQW